jgi:hypothetical protein
VSYRQLAAHPKKADDDEQLACSRMIEFARKYVKLLCARKVVPGRPVF